MPIKNGVYSAIEINITELDLLELFYDIGFVKIKSHNPGAGWATEYKYRPDYLESTHYTLVTFESDVHKLDDDTKYTSTDFRLYIHNNIDGSFNESVFQMGVSKHDTYCKKKIISILNDRFRMELRDKLLSSLFN